MKKLMCWLLVFAMLLSFVPAAVSADDGYYTVAGTEDLCGSGWNPGDPNNQMTLNEETGLYEKYYINVPAGRHEFKVTDGTWSNSWGMDGGNYILETAKVQNVLITFNAETTEIGVELIDVKLGIVERIQLGLVAFFATATGFRRLILKIEIVGNIIVNPKDFLGFFRFGRSFFRRFLRRICGSFRQWGCRSSRCPKQK